MFVQNTDYAMHKHSYGWKLQLARLSLYTGGVSASLD